MPKARWQLLSIFTSRPRLSVSLLAGLAAGLISALHPGLATATSAILGWNVFCGLFLVLIALAARGADSDKVRARAVREDEGRGLILTLVLVASFASLGATAIELTQAKHDTGLAQAAHVAAAFWTVAISWLVVQVVFALHYAHEYYAPSDGKDRKLAGLAFPGTKSPDDWDFLHFSIIIGVASQTADIAFTSRGMRQVGTLHSLVAFAFNTFVVALTINLLAGLF